MRFLRYLAKSTNLANIRSICNCYAIMRSLDVRETGNHRIDRLSNVQRACCGRCARSTAYQPIRFADVSSRLWLRSRHTMLTRFSPLVFRMILDFVCCWKEIDWLLLYRARVIVNNFGCLLPGLTIHCLLLECWNRVNMTRQHMAAVICEKSLASIIWASSSARATEIPRNDADFVRFLGIPSAPLLRSLRSLTSKRVLKWPECSEIAFDYPQKCIFFRATRAIRIYQMLFLGAINFWWTAMNICCYIYTNKIEYHAEKGSKV